MSDVVELEVIEGERLLEMGNIEREQSNIDEALCCFEKALKIFRKHAIRSCEGIALGKLGLVYETLGQRDRAIELYTTAIDIFWTGESLREAPKV